VRIDQFEGRVAFVTGGAQGIGLGVARARRPRCAGWISLRDVEIRRGRAIGSQHHETQQLLDALPSALRRESLDAG
jgi:NAD(P)-dependent dehydrogenase (short-subunit alcohol dehydrogenase family)